LKGSQTTVHEPLLDLYRMITNDVIDPYQ